MNHIGCQDLQYTWLDFNVKDENIRSGNLQRLVDLLHDELIMNGYFVATMKNGYDLRKEFNTE
jgi:hypothetical protein